MKRLASFSWKTNAAETSQTRILFAIFHTTIVLRENEIPIGLISQRRHSAHWSVQAHKHTQLSVSVNFYRTSTPPKPHADHIKTSSQVTNSTRIDHKYRVLLSGDVDEGLEWLHAFESTHTVMNSIPCFCKRGWRRNVNTDYANNDTWNTRLQSISEYFATRDWVVRLTCSLKINSCSRSDFEAEGYRRKANIHSDDAWHTI